MEKKNKETKDTDGSSQHHREN